jgi:asparagine synthase (glutamine-hydrolysing)
MAATYVGRCSMPQLQHERFAPEVVYWTGRLDNRGDLQTALGPAYRTETNSAALALAAYERWGTAGLGRIIGDWSVVIRDTNQQSLVLASDFAGVRPLFYVRRQHELFWSCRLDALVEATGLDAIDEAYVGAFLTIGGHPRRTPFAGISTVPAGHAVTITAERVTTSPFWTMPVSDVIAYADERRYDEQLRGLFREAVAVRLQTPRTVVAELSGGLDSSSVVCMANHLIRRGEVAAPQLATVSYVHRDSLDLPYIREVEAFCAIEGVHLSTHRTPLVTDEAVGRASPQPWTSLHKEAAGVARQLGASVLLTGQNGDLAMGNWLDDSLQVAAPLRTGRIGRAMRESLAWSKTLRVPVARILSRALWTLLPMDPDELYALNTSVEPQCAETSLRQEFIGRMGADDPDRLFSTDWKQARPERRKHFRALTILRELRTLQSLEPVQALDYTHPFAHRPLVEFAMSVPPEVLCRPGQPRRLMRRALGDILPPRLRARRSKGLFGTPWFDALRPLAQGLLKVSPWQVVARGWIDRANLTARLEKLIHGLDCNESQLRQIILLEYWLRQWTPPRPTHV